MMMSFNQLATNRSVSPNDLAQGIGVAVIPPIIGGLIGLIGIVLIVVGLLSPRMTFRDAFTEAKASAKHNA